MRPLVFLLNLYFHLKLLLFLQLLASQPLLFQPVLAFQPLVSKPLSVFQQV
jgi:hypothetical protein